MPTFIPNGKFIISLDFELFWGMRDKKNLQQYGNHILGVQQVIPQLISIFNQHHISATFATVGFLFFKNPKHLLQHLPNTQPTYQHPNLSPYPEHIPQIIDNEQLNIYHFAPHLIQLIQQHPQHEIATHTFSHYYCLEPGQTTTQFETDLQQAQKIANTYQIQLKTIVFPRNQYNSKYLQIAKNQNITCYRGNENTWIYAPANAQHQTLIRRALRLVDTYLNISGHNCYSDSQITKQQPIMNIPSSRFLRPFSKKLAFLDPLKLNRIKTDMSHAAKNNLTYHLWWHPHNFGINQKQNFDFLQKILQHYTYLNQHYNFKSYTMNQLANQLKQITE